MSEVTFEAGCRAAVERLHIRGLQGEGIHLGLLDTGVDSTHPALEGAVRDCVEVDPDGAIAPSTDRDSGEHGTQSAGVMAARPIGSHPGGCAPWASICCATVLEGRRSLLRVLVGINWLLDQRVRIVCVPFGTPDRTPIFDGALEALERAGVLVVAAVGNRGAGSAASPADRNGVLAVGAVDAAGQVPRFSGGRSFAPEGRTVPDLVAPGCDVLTPVKGGGYATASGTSIAAAWVAGAAALVLQAHPDCVPRRLIDALRAGSQPLRRTARHRGGCGVIDPEASLAWLDERGVQSSSAPAPATAPASVFVDPRLQVQLSTAAPDGLVEALVLGRDSEIGAITRRLAADLGAPLVSALQLPRLRTLFLRARPEVLRVLATSSEVVALSAPDTFANVRLLS